MTKTEISRILKSASVCKLKVFKSRNVSGIEYVSIAYNKLGHSKPFDPLYKIDDAIKLLENIGGTLTINDEKSECLVYFGGDEFTTVVKGYWKSKPKNKEKNICNAIVNFVLTKGKLPR